MRFDPFQNRTRKNATDGPEKPPRIASERFRGVTPWDSTLGRLGRLRRALRAAGLSWRTRSFFGAPGVCVFCMTEGTEGVF